MKTVYIPKGHTVCYESLETVSAHIFRKKRTFSVNARCLHKIIQKKAG